MLRALLVTAGLLVSLAVPADTVMLEHLYVAELPDHEQAQTIELRELALARNFEAAVSGAKSMLIASGFQIDTQDALSALTSDNELTKATGLMLLGNYALFLAASGDLAGAQTSLDRGRSLALEMKHDSRLMVKASMAEGLITLSLGDYDAAATAFKRVQLLVHREDGVSSVEQLDALAYLSLTERMRGNLEASDQYQESSLLAVARTFGEESPEMLNELVRVGGYFAARGAGIPIVSAGQIRSSHACLGVGFPFNTCDLGLAREESGQLQRSRQASDLRRARESAFIRSIALLEQAVEIHGLLPANRDYSKVRILRAVASAQLQKGDFNQAYKTMMEAISASETASNSSREQLEVLLATGDLLHMRGDRDARALYLKSWQLLQTDQALAETHGGLFDAPLRLVPERFHWLPLEQEAGIADAEADLYVRTIYDVNAKGRVERIRIVESTLPGKHIRDIKQQLKRARFRPRIMDGKFVRSEHHAHRFNYPPEFASQDES